MTLKKTDLIFIFAMGVISSFVANQLYFSKKDVSTK